MALKLPRGHSLTTENQEIPRCLLLNNTLYYNICVFRIIKFIWYKNNTSFAHSVWPQYHDLIKLEFTLPDHASTKVTACNTYWFLRKRILKDFSSYILMQKWTVIPVPSELHSDLIKLECTLLDDLSTKVTACLAYSPKIALCISLNFGWNRPSRSWKEVENIQRLQTDWHTIARQIVIRKVHLSCQLRKANM